MDHLESNVGHAVLITGYQDNANFSGGGYFIAKNSWGTTPPNQNPSQPAGYYEVPYSDIGVDAYHVVDALSGPAYFTGALGSGTWSGGSGTWSGGSGGWNTGGGTWANGENQAVFSAAGGAIAVGSYTSAHGLTFNAGAKGYSLAGGPLIVTGSGISAAESVTINSALTVGAPQTWTVASGKQLTISGSLNLNISPLTIAGGGTTRISGPIHDASTDPLLGAGWTGPVGTLTMDGSGLLILSGNNTYSGGTNVESGILEFTSPGAMAEGTSLTVGRAAAAIFDAPALATPSITGGGGVPEPGTLALLGSGVVGLLCFASMRGNASGKR
jgi:autotransporter-associated beta strand protein